MLKRQLLYQSVHFQDTIQNSWIPLLCCFSDQHPCPGLCHQRSQELQTRRVYPWRNGPGTSSSKYDTQPHPSPKIINKNTKDSMETYRNLGSQSLRRFFLKIQLIKMAISWFFMAYHISKRAGLYFFFGARWRCWAENPAPTSASCHPRRMVLSSNSSIWIGAFSISFREGKWISPCTITTHCYIYNQFKLHLYLQSCSQLLPWPPFFENFKKTLSPPNQLCCMVHMKVTDAFGKPAYFYETAM